MKASSNINAAEKAFLSSLPLFQGVEKDVLNNLLLSAYSKTHTSKNVLIFQGEKASHLHVILEGYVKISRNSIEGNESIPQILGRGETFTEAAIFLNENSPVSAESIDKSRILHISADAVIKAAQTNHSFAMNLLKVISAHSYSLIQQIEQTTLKSATQRVGRFLVKTMLENKPRSLQFNLPCEKSLIAAHLGITPETFSRALKKLREENISIANKEISIPETFSLCRYCDHDLARTCKYGDTDKCILNHR